MKIRQVKNYNDSRILADWWYYSLLRRKYRDVYYYIRNRFFRKYYLLDIKAMSRHEWWDSDYQIFHAVFQILVNYVENELGDGGKNAEKLAMEHLEWESHLDDGMDIDYSKGETQASVAKKVRELYLWYKHERPTRMDPFDMPGEPECLNRPWKRGEPDINGYAILDDGRTLEENEMVMEYYKKVDELEKQYEDEDTKKLKEVIDIRAFLWT